MQTINFNHLCFLGADCLFIPIFAAYGAYNGYRLWKKENRHCRD